MAIPPELQNLATPLDYVGVIPGSAVGIPGYETRLFFYNITNATDEVRGVLTYNAEVFLYAGQIDGHTLPDYAAAEEYEGAVPDDARVTLEMYNFFESPVGQDFIATNYP
jgi:hypothetical protein